MKRSTARGFLATNCRPDRRLCRPAAACTRRRSQRIHPSRIAHTLSRTTTDVTTSASTRPLSAVDRRRTRETSDMCVATAAFADPFAILIHGVVTEFKRKQKVGRRKSGYYNLGLFNGKRTFQCKKEIHYNFDRRYRCRAWDSIASLNGDYHS